MREIVSANNVDLCVETFGDRKDPPILLIMGSNASMDWWEDGFCERLAAAGRFAIRYDLRDTGESVTYPPGESDYGFDDLVEDAAGILDALGIERAHVAAMSMGGGIAQLLGERHPEKVASLTLISTASSAADAPEVTMSEETMARFGEAETPDWSDREAVIGYGTHLARVSAATSEPFDEAGMRELWGRVFDRTANIESTFENHGPVVATEPVREGPIGVPTLVIHGDEDPVVRLEYGEALAREAPGSWLIVLPGVGHELPRRTWDVVVPAIAEHTAAR